MIIWNGPYETQCTRLAAGKVIDLASSQGGNAGFTSTGTLSVEANGNSAHSPGVYPRRAMRVSIFYLPSEVC